MVFPRKSDLPFFLVMITISATYILFIVALLLVDVTYSSWGHFWQALSSREIQFAIKLSLLTCTLSTLLSLLVAVPIGYLLSRYNFPGKALVDCVIDIPIVLPPLVIGLSLLIFFQTRAGLFIERHVSVTYEVPSIVIAQFMVACAFAVRTMHVTFQQIDQRQEQVALTLGCTAGQAFTYVVLPEAKKGLLTAASIAWARSLGEFGPILIFSGATRMRTEVLPTTVFLEMSVGNVEAAVAVSVIMVLAAVVVLLLIRLAGNESNLVVENRNRP